MERLTGKQRRYLRGLAHDLDPVVQVGQHGLRDAVLEEIDAALEAHELIKIRFVGSTDEKKAIARTVEERLDCRQVGMIGHVAILYRPAEAPEERRIDLPAGSA